MISSPPPCLPSVDVSQKSKCYVYHLWTAMLLVALYYIPLLFPDPTSLCSGISGID